MQDKETVGILTVLAIIQLTIKAQEAKTRKGETVQLSKKETMLLKLLIENKNEVVPREKILAGGMGLQCISYHPALLIISS